MIPEHLFNNAMWIVMDCWDQQPYNGRVGEWNAYAEYPDINLYNRIAQRRILSVISRARHVAVSCYCDAGVQVAEPFQKYQNILDPERLTGYMSEHGLSDIVYTGFHRGICIIHRPTGAREMNQRGFKCYQIDRLAIEFPGVNKKHLDKPHHGIIQTI